jgi:hypothetical protein
MFHLGHVPSETPPKVMQLDLIIAKGLIFQCLYL